MVGVIVWHLHNVDLEDLGRAEPSLVDGAGVIELEEARVDGVDVRRRLLEAWRPIVDALRDRGVLAYNQHAEMYAPAAERDAHASAVVFEEGEGLSGAGARSPLHRGLKFLNARPPAGERCAPLRPISHSSWGSCSVHAAFGGGPAPATTRSIHSNVTTARQY